MQSVIILFLTIGSLFEFASSSPGRWNHSGSLWTQKPRFECGTKVTPRQIRAERERRARGDFDALLAPQANKPYHIPLTIHIVRRDDGTGGFSLENLQAAMLDLNRLWQPYGVQFYQRGAVDYIDNDRYTVIISEERRIELRGVNSVANTINVYFTNIIDLCGESAWTTSSAQGVLISNDCAGVENNPSTFAHEIGHYFDLYHTHETAFGVECPSGGNCPLTGDLLCDTAADPTLDFEDNVTAACAWTGSATNPSGCSSGSYNPPTRNVMSYSRQTCRDQFTGQQTSKSLNVLTTASNRSNLINVAKYVAPDGSATSGCTYQNPCRTLARAVQLANPGDHIFLLSGTYSETTTVNKAVFLKKWNTDAGTVIIGE